MFLIRKRNKKYVTTGACSTVHEFVRYKLIVSSKPASKALESPHKALNHCNSIIKQYIPIKLTCKTARTRRRARGRPPRECAPAAISQRASLPCCHLLPDGATIRMLNGFQLLHVSLFYPHFDVKSESETRNK